jgi:hypothetical protein
VTKFSHCFLLMFGQMAVGGAISLAVPPFTVIERGFYKSSAGIYLGFALLFIAGKIGLAVRVGELTSNAAWELGCWLSLALALGWYLATLWGDRNEPRARAFLATLCTGVVALTVSANEYRVGSLLSPAVVLYPVSIIMGALALGTVGTGMLLGHWYLIDLGLSIEPLKRLHRFYMWVTGLQVATIVLTIGLMALTAAGATAASSLLTDHRELLAMRVILGPGAALAIGWMIGRTLAIPQTMAATGLFYIAILAVIVGEMLGRLILFRTSLPL